MHILQVSSLTDADIFYLGQYFRSELLVRCLTGKVAGLKITGETLVLPIESTKWCVLLVVAGWLIVGRFTRSGRGERRE